MSRNSGQERPKPVEGRDGDFRPTEKQKNKGFDVFFEDFKFYECDDEDLDDDEKYCLFYERALEAWNNLPEERRMK